LPGGTNVNAIIGALYKDLGFDPIDSFASIAAICTDSMALAISPHVPAQSFQEFVDFAKNNPQGLGDARFQNVGNECCFAFMPMREAQRAKRL
jgi:tripartite-type tricarboxylate transporter receptor subunit TctC